MKKKILILIMMISVLLVPMTTMAAEKKYTSQNLDEVLTEEKIEHDFSNYKETDDQITIYMFRGRGCTYCAKFLNFLNSIIDDYGKYFKVEAYEVWNDQNNETLLTEVANFLGKNAGGVPFIVIGDQVFGGYDESFNESIKQAIKNLYNSKDRYDVLEEIEKEKRKEEWERAKLVVVNISAVVISTLVILLFVHHENKKLEVKIEKLATGVNKIEKAEKTEKATNLGKSKSDKKEK